MGELITVKFSRNEVLYTSVLFINNRESNFFFSHLWGLYTSSSSRRGRGISAVSCVHSVFAVENKGIGLISQGLATIHSL